jgi:replicative DNA helicase
MAKAKHISFDIKLTKKYIKKRADGLLPSALTPWNQVNNSLLDGIPWWTVATIAGSSGSGKSTVMESLKYFIIDNDPTVMCLSVELDMICRQNIMRRISKITGFSINKLSSGKDGSLTEAEKLIVDQELDKLNEYPIFNIDRSLTVEELSEEIDDFIVSNGFKDETGVKKKLLVTIDYVSLLKGKRGEDKRLTLESLYEMLVDKKKMCEEEEIPVLFICLSQLNRDVFNSQRVSNPSLHYPSEADFFGSSAIFTLSDLVIMSMNPSKIRGIEAYGPYKYPIKSLTGFPYIYMHLMKVRFAEAGGVLKMQANFKVSEIYDSL